MLKPKEPVPFAGVEPAIRAGFTVFEDQNLDMPLGTKPRSYAINSTRRQITNSHYRKANQDLDVQLGKCCTE